MVATCFHHVYTKYLNVKPLPHSSLFLFLVSTASSEKDFLLRDKEIRALEAQLQETKTLSKQKEQECETIAGEVTISAYIWCKSAFLDKLKFEVAERDQIVSKLLKEKSQLHEQFNTRLSEQKESIEGQYSIAVLIWENMLTEFEAEVTKRDERIAQLTEKLQQHIKEASSVGVQFDYLIPSMGKK